MERNKITRKDVLDLFFYMKIVLIEVVGMAFLSVVVTSLAAIAW